MIWLAIFLGLTSIFTSIDLHKTQKKLEHLQQIQNKTVEACGEAWLNQK